MILSRRFHLTCVVVAHYKTQCVLTLSTGTFDYITMPKSNARKDRAPKLKANQLKIIQYLLSTASYVSVLQSPPTRGVTIKANMVKYDLMIVKHCFEKFTMIMFSLKPHRYYHGEGNDQIGHVGMFLNGKGRYAVLWETMNSENSDVIAEGFGPISGISRKSIEDVVRRSTLSGKKEIDGRQLLSKAKVALKDAKILLSYWYEFIRNGMPSGKDETDALKYVLNRAFEERSQERDDDDEDDEDLVAPVPVTQQVIWSTQNDNNVHYEDDNANVSPIVVQQNRRSGQDDNNDSDSENDDQSIDDFLNDYEERKAFQDNVNDGMLDDVVDNVEESYRPSRGPNFYPAALVLFMLYGPYGVGQYGMEISPAFSIDTEGIDEVGKGGKFNTKSIKEEKTKDDDKER